MAELGDTAGTVWPLMRDPDPPDPPGDEEERQETIRRTNIRLKDLRYLSWRIKKMMQFLTGVRIWEGRNLYALADARWDEAAASWQMVEAWIKSLEKWVRDNRAPMPGNDEAEAEVKAEVKGGLARYWDAREAEEDEGDLGRRHPARDQ